MAGNDRNAYLDVGACRTRRFAAWYCGSDSHEYALIISPNGCTFKCQQSLLLQKWPVNRRFLQVNRIPGFDSA